MKNDQLQIADAVIHPGESITLALPLPEIYTCAPMYMPIQVVHGKEKGPTLLVCAARYGDEINGTAIIHRLLKSAMLKKLHGTLLAIPVMNVFGLINRSPNLVSGAEFDRSFPGTEAGSHAARLAHLVTTQILPKLDYIIDLRSGPPSQDNLAHIHVDSRDTNAFRLAKNFQVPLIVPTNFKHGTLAETARGMDISVMTYKAGEALRVDESAIRSGVRGIANVMCVLNMLPNAKIKTKKAFHPVIAKETNWITSPRSGLAQMKIKLGQRANAGDNIGIVSDPFGTSQQETVTAPDSAIVVAKNTLPLVNEGENLLRLATFKQELEQVETQIEQWQETHQT